MGWNLVLQLVKLFHITLIFFILFFKILSQALLECHKASVEAGNTLKLRVFVAGRNRLENEGAAALAESLK